MSLTKGAIDKNAEPNVEAASVETTVACLSDSLSCVTDLPLDFLSIERIARPPFTFIHTLVKIFVEKLSFAGGLYDENELERAESLSRQEKIRFLFKVLACVSLITNERVDLFVSPAKVLSGQDVQTTHYFLRCLAKAATVAPEISMLKAAEINETGVNLIYKQSVKIRSTVVRIQACFRGVLTRIQLRNDKEDCLHNESGVGTNYSVPPFAEKEPKMEKGPIQASNEFSTEEEEEKMNSNSSYISSHSSLSNLDGGDDHSVSAEYSERGRIENKIDTSFQKGELSIVSDNDGEDASTRRMDVKNGNCSTSTSILPTIPEKKVIKKFKIVNGVKIRDVVEVIQDRKEENDQKTKSAEEEVDCLLSQLKIKMKKLQDKEAQLEQKGEATRQKEEHLRIYEARVSKLATSLRKKEERLKQERIKQTLEMDKLRLAVSDSSLRENFELKKPIESPEDDNEIRYEDLWKRACNNPTITDLRLKLEAKQNAMKKRQERMIKMEKELKLKLEEVEEERKQLSDEKKALHESTRNNARQKRKPPTSNAKSKANKAIRKEEKVDVDEEITDSEENFRRQAFHGKNVENSELLEQLAQISKKKKKKLHHRNRHSKNGYDKRSINKVIFQDNEESSRNASKSPPLSGERSEGNFILTDDVPRSLIRYSTHYSSKEK